MHWFNCAEMRGLHGVSRGTSPAVTPVANSNPDNLPEGNTVLPCSSFHALMVLLACKVGQHEHLSAWVFISGEAHACYSVFSSLSM